MTIRDIDASLRAAVDDGRVAGVVAGAADRNGEIYRGAFGNTGADRPAAMAEDSIFRIASMTKALTSVAVMQLVEQGQLALDEPARAALPKLGELRVLDGFEADGAPRLRPAGDGPSIRELLTHTSGFAYEMWCDPIVRLLRENEASDPSATPPRLSSIFAGGAGFMEAPLVFEPGTRWQYGISTDWLGELVEQVSGARLDSYFSQHICEPLGMIDTCFAPSAAQLERLVALHHRQADGSLASIQAGVVAVDDFYSGGGGLVSTAGDYLRFLRALLGGGELDRTRILSAKSVAEMSRNQIGTLQVETLATTDPETSADVDFFPGVSKSWGLGFLINDEPVGSGRAAGSYGWAGLFNSYYWVDPASGLCAVLLSQQLPFFDAGAVTLLGDFERALYRGAA